MSESVRTEVLIVGAAAVGVLTLTRPDQRNPLDHATVTALLAGLDEIGADGEVNAVVVTGSGPAFSAGGDLKAYRDLYARPDAFAAFLTDFATLCSRLERGPFVSIAMVNGTCVAGGLELLLACDVALMSDDAVIGDAHLAFGQLPGAGGSQRLGRAVGHRTARRLLLTGQMLAADEALTLGLVAQVCPPEQLRQRTLDLAARSARFSPLTIRHAKTLLDIAVNVGQDEGLAAERDLVQAYATESHDATEGLLAFAERRTPQFRGR